MKYAELAVGAYKSSEDDGTLNRLKQNGWDVEETYIDETNGYRAVLFFNRNTQERVMSYAGTDDFPDVITDVLQGTFGGSQQYVRAVSDSMSAKAAHGPISRFVGHSLGGGLASLASITNRIPATTFNAAGLNIWTASMWGRTLEGAEDLIEAYRVRGEFLSTIQDASPAWLAAGAVPGWTALGAALLGLAGAMMPNGVGKAYWLAETSSSIFTRHKMLTDVIPGIMRA